MVTRGEVWWMEAPDRKGRPVVVLSRGAIAARAQRVTVAEITTRVRGFVTEVALDTEDGMSRPCVASLTSLSTVYRGYLTRHVATLGPVRMAQICEALKIAVAC